MAIWDKISSTGNVEDRRGSGLLLGGGSLGVVGVVLLLAFNILGGTGDPTLDQLINQAITSTPSSQTESGEFAGKDSYEVFASKVLGSTNDTWRAQLQSKGVSYTEPKLVLFRAATPSGCGTATSAVGPHYCPNDMTIYLDESFFDELKNKLGGSNGDVAQAYVIAHESGHHLQNLLGTLNKASAAQDSNASSIGTELQADCYAGVWLRSISDQNVLDQGEMNEAMSAASAVGDDRIQQKVDGQINPETWTHGSSAQRTQWLNTGFDKGLISACTSI